MTERYAELLVRAATEGLALHQDGVILAANPALGALVGCAPGDLSGRRLLDLAAPESRDALAAALRDTSGAPHDIEWVGEGGRRFPALVRSGSLADGGAPVRTLSVHATEPTGETAEALRRSQLHLEAAQAQAGLGSWEWNAVRQTFTWSRELYRLFGLDPAGGVPEREAFLELVHPDDRSSVRHAQLAANAGRRASAEFRTNPARGPVRYLRGTVDSIQGFDGQILRMSGTVLDVTSQREAQQAIRDSEARYRNLFESAPIGIGVADARGGLLEFNDALLAPGGYAREDIERVGNIHELYADAAERDEVLALVRSQGFVRQHEVRFKRRDGSSYDAAISLAPVVIDNAPCMLAMVEDITNRKTAERALQENEIRFRALIENSYDVITMFAPDGSILYVSPSVRRVLGYDPDELIGTPGIDIIHQGDLAQAERDFALALGDPSLTVQTSHRLRHADGSYRTVEITGRNLLDDPTVGAMVLNFRDITEHRALEEQLRHAQKMEALGQLTGGIAHDFNNLLTTVLGSADLLSQKLSGASRDTLKDLEHVRRAALRGAEMVRKLLAFSRKEGLRFTPVDLVELCEEMTQMLQRVLPETVRIVARTSSAPAVTGVDPGAVQQMVMNLATNATDAMPVGGVLTVAVDRARIDQAFINAQGWGALGDYIRITVSDTGHGMDEDTQRRVFDPFFTTKPMEEGTGLGMSMVYGLIKQHEGFVRVHTERGRGTDVSLFFPATTPAPSVQPESVVEEPMGGRETILVVEDDDQVRDLAQRILGGAGYEVFAAADGEAALGVLAEQRGIDLVLTDVVMPRLGGRELFREARARGCAARFIFTSGYSDVTHGPLESDAQPARLLNKPWSPRDLKRYVRQTLDEARTPPQG